MLLAVFFPFFMALVCWLLAPRMGRNVGYLAALGFVPVLMLAPQLQTMPYAQPINQVWQWVPDLGLNLAFRGDGFSLLFALLIGIIGFMAIIYSIFYLYSNEKFGRFYPYLLIFGGSMLGLVLTDNLLALFAFWEMTSISSFLLIGLWHTRSAARDGAIKALLVSALGGVGLLAAVALLSIAGGTLTLSQLNIATLQQSPLFVPALLCTLLAACTKSAQLPFHLWLPTAMEAPTPVSAFLHSATMVKAGVVLVAKFGLIFGSSPLWSGILVPLGLATLLWGSWLALRQTDLKALLAFSTVSQLGLLMSLYGLATAEGRFVATAHLINHAAFKAALFFVVGILDHATGTREIPLLRSLHTQINLRRLMPITFIITLLASLSMAGIPPLGGFISKEMFYEAMLHSGPLYTLVAVLGSSLTLAYTARLLSLFWLPMSQQQALDELKLPEFNFRQAHEASIGLWLPAGILAAVALLFGIWPSVAEYLVRSAGVALEFSAYKGHLKLWHGFNLALLLTLLTWLLGGLLIWKSEVMQRVQRRLAPRWSANTLYYNLIEQVNRFATTFMTYTQGLALPDQLRLTLLATGFIIGSVLWVVPIEKYFASWLWADLAKVPPTFLPIGVLLVAGAWGVLISRNPITAVIVTGLTGFGSAAAFLALRAPDLALTQLLVEAVTVILFLLAFRYLPRVRDLPRRGIRWLLDVWLAGSAGLFVVLLMLLSLQGLIPSIMPYYLHNSYVGGGGKNVVNVILVDFRGFDTFGEILVVGMVALVVTGLVRVGKRNSKTVSSGLSEPKPPQAITELPAPAIQQQPTGQAGQTEQSEQSEQGGAK